MVRSLRRRPPGRRRLVAGNGDAESTPRRTRLGRRPPHVVLLLQGGCRCFDGDRAATASRRSNRRHAERCAISYSTVLGVGAWFGGNSGGDTVSSRTSSRRETVAVAR